MVRRLDPVWGDFGDAMQAHADTHHYTNACPQVHSFNDGIWGELEDWILSQEKTRNSKASVFTGPIFHDGDPVYAGVRVPVRFYKVVVVVDDAKGQLSATAFNLDQSGDLPLEEAAPQVGFDPGRFKQMTISQLELWTGLDFGNLPAFDSFAAHFPAAVSGETLPQLPLRSVRDAVLWRPSFGNAPRN
jgi:endonuclease G